ncbi:MAG: sigma-70 family RNA polymerase sigma factor [Candidatus Scalindua sp. AMX11]|nr:MAG: RNA polymerase subunit sigma-24 [Candidatus Scalindua sp.]NOG83563.1 sigma-70 family RNA polymerase sigma factor [Planctomycetota bacterium]RZV70933.1 MAG: sigma-70 family RNA polymerase sigma factor [Candidatus Scalindua sp. SCAELEC01]TDE64240.1 MAG: sigma-70 family RNA polymerase sigma factor [Candidatus Scalindua sp. AMX11]GJQ59967.1 MAG: RNA polymerase sigma factor RpoE [Candidatus Scalindua sp.]
MKSFGESEEKASTLEQSALEYMDTLFNFAMRMTGNREDAEDLVQETYMKMHRFLHTFDEGSNLKAWLFKILRNTFINKYRKKLREPQEVHDNNDDFSLYDTIAGESEYDPYGKSSFKIEEHIEDEVKEALENLPLAFKEVVFYSDLEGLTYEEISDVIGCPIGTVKSRLYRSRKLLQKLLWEYAKKKGYLKGE